MRGSTAATKCCAPSSSTAGFRVSLQRAFDDPHTWGVLLVDLARHAARIYAEEAEMTEEHALEEIRRMFDAEWDRSTDPGLTDKIN